MADVGRPTSMTNETLRILMDGFMKGYSDEEACASAQISPATLYNYQKEHPEFLEQKEQWKQNPILKAKTVVYTALERNDKETAKWYLERKKKDEFSARNELTGKDGQDLLPKPILGGVANALPTNDSNSQNSGSNETN